MTRGVTRGVTRGMTRGVTRGMTRGVRQATRRCSVPPPARGALWAARSPLAPNDQYQRNRRTCNRTNVQPNDRTNVHPGREAARGGYGGPLSRVNSAISISDCSYFLSDSCGSAPAQRETHAGRDPRTTHKV
jgi:hypothetical protein